MQRRWKVRALCNDGWVESKGGSLPEPLSVYGDNKKFRARLRDLIGQGDELIAEIDAIESRYEAPPSTRGLAAALQAMPFVTVVPKRLTDWHVRVHKALVKYLGKSAPEWRSQSDLLESGNADVIAACMRAREQVRATQNELRDILSRVPGRHLSMPAPSGPDLVELRASGLVAEAVLDGYAKRMSKFNTTHQLAEAIGASKELVEATSRALLTLLGEPVTKNDDFPSLGRNLRKALEQRSGFAPKGKGADILTRLQQGISTSAHALNALRNEYGTGHGRPGHADGLDARHARLAVDLAVTHCRFLVLTAQDLDLLTGP